MRKPQNESLKEIALGVLRATVMASDKWLKYDMGQAEVRLDIGDWSIGKICQRTFDEELDALAISQLSRDKCRLEYIVQLSKALFTTSSELLGLHERRMKPLSMKASKGLDTLPDEVLAIVFSFATLDEQEGTRRVLWLSQVSRRFRGVALGDPRLWSTIRLWRKSTRECTETCITRCGENTDLHIILNYGRAMNPDVHEDFIKTCFASASRWSSLTLTNDLDGEDGTTQISKRFVRLMGTQSLVLPQLRELSLGQCYWSCRYKLNDLDAWMDLRRPESFSKNISWETPNLRVVRCIQCIPHASLPLTSFTTFSLSLVLNTAYKLIMMANVLEFLQQNITTFDLELDSDASYLHLESDLDLVVCPAVTTFKLQLTLAKINPITNSEDLFKPIWRSLVMPNLEDYTLSIGCRSGENATEALEKHSIFFAQPNILLPHPDTHPNLTIVTIVARDSRSNGEGESPTPRQTNVMAKILAMNVSLGRIPHVTTLNLSTFSQLSFSRHGQDSVVVNRSCRLRELRLRSCENLDAGGLKKMVQSLKYAGAWGTLERVYVEQCDLLDYKSALEVVGGERLRFGR